MEKILSQALGQDVSKLAAQEKQLLLSRLLANLAHEIRNPLSSLDIHVQLLAEDLEQTAPEVRRKVGHRLDVIRGELHRLETVVRHFISLARPSSLDVQAVDLGAIARHVAELLGPEAAERGIELVTRVDAAVPVLQADPTRLTQALLNVVINALQAVERDGRVEIDVTLDPEGRHAVMSVSDSGPGLPAEARATILEPFYTTRKDGAGLGLWIVQQIVLAHQGEILLGEATGGGGKVGIALPIR